MRSNAGKNAVIAVPAFVLGIVLAGTLAQAQARPAAVSSNTKWEYSIVDAPQGAPPMQAVSAAGLKGWEAFQVVERPSSTSFYLRRPLN